MTRTNQLTIEGIEYKIVISDDSEALLAAQAAGSAVVGLWCPGSDQDLSMAKYLVERIEDANEDYLEGVIRRLFGLDIVIAETSRLRIREFRPSDWSKIPREAGDVSDDRVFYEQSALSAYIQNQYRFFEYGLWALEEKQNGSIVGKAGISGTLDLPVHKEPGMELGYHVFSPHQRRGYGTEACLAIMEYAKQEYLPPFLAIKTDTSNEASICLAKKLGFIPVKKHTEANQDLCLFWWNC